MAREAPPRETVLVQALACSTLKCPQRVRGPMRSLLVLAASITLALAGCMTATTDSASGPDTNDDGATSARTLSWGIAECAAAITFIPVDAAAVTPHLPEGFRAVAPSEIGLPAPVDLQGDATISVELFTCGGTTGPDGNESEGGAYGSVFVTVEPPEELKDPDAGLHFVKFDTIVSNAALREALLAAGVPAVEGEATIDVPLVGAGTMSGRIGDAPYSMRLAYPPTPPADMTLTFVEFTPVANGLVAWKATATGVSGSASGTIELAPGSLPAEVVGSTTTQMWALLFEGSFSEATITLPA